MRISKPPIAITALLSSLALAACQQPASPAPDEASATPTAPDSKPGMQFLDGALILPVVDGRPGAVYFNLRNGSDSPVSLVSAHVEGAANAEIHETEAGSMKRRDTISISPGQSLSFARGGLHVMAFDLSEELADGGETEVTLTFADGDKLSAPVEIRSLSSASEDMHSSHEGPKN